MGSRQARRGRHRGGRPGCRVHPWARVRGCCIQLATLLLCGIAGTGWAAEPPLVYESSWCGYDVRLDEARLVWLGKKRVKERYVVKTTAGLDMTRFVLNENTLIDIKKVEVRIERRGRWQDVELLVNEMSPWSGYPEFSDEIIRGYAIPDLRLGDRVELEYEQSYKGVWEIPRHPFGGLEPRARQILEIRVPQDVVLALHVTAGLLGGPSIDYSRRDEGNKQVHVWEARDWPGLDGPEPDAPSFTDLMPTVFAAACSLRSRHGDAAPVRATWADFARWYEARVAPQFELDRDLQTFLDVARRDAHSEEELMARIYGMVQHRVRYLAYTIGEGGWLPHAAPTTYANQYGDCKDMSTLIVALLRGAGIPAHLALVQSRAKTTQVQTDFPYSMQFDHCVAYVRTDAGDLWMDATGPTSFGDVPGFISAHPALVLDGENTRFLRPTHPDGSEGEIREHFVLDELHSTGGRLRFRFEFLGPVAHEYRQRAAQAKASDRLEIAEAMLRPCFTSVSGIQLAEAHPEPGANLVGECRVQPPGRWRETEDGRADAAGWLVRTGITAMRLPVPSLARKLPYRFGTTRVYCSETTVMLPWAAQPDSLAAALDEDFGSFEIAIRTEGQRLVSRRRLQWKQDVITIEQLQRFQDFLRDVRQANDRLWEIRR